MKNIAICVGVGVAVIGLACLYPMFTGKTVVTDDQLQKIVFVDQKTGEAFVLPARTSPAKNPVTGEATLIPGMYCEKCKAWKPVGSMESLQTNRSVHKCKVHRIALSRVGPLPEKKPH